MDRISGLPDEVLCHILSFLPTKLAALTSVLSTKWRNLLVFVPNLDITCHTKIVPVDSIYYGIPKEIMYGTMLSFRGFIDRVLALQGDSSIKKVSLNCINYVHPDHLDRWICNVLRRGVSELETAIYDQDGDDDFNYLLPQEMFVSRTLVKLKLGNFEWWPGAKGTFLPKLKTLVVNFWDCSDKLEKIHPAFPVLEELYIESITWKDSGDSVSSASLKRLTIHANGCQSMVAHITTSMSISFDTPSVLYLEYSDEVASYYPKVNLPNLVDAVLDLNIRDFEYMKLDRERYDDGLRNYVVLRCGNLCKLMTGIGNVKTLTFSSNTLELFFICFESMPAFNNLKMLRISGSVHPVGWQAMPVFLQNCPHLDTVQMEYLCAWDCISLEEKGGWLISCPEMTLFAGRDYPTDIFDLVVKMVNLCNGSYRAVVKNASWCVIRPIYEVDS
ncbi:F-box/LRR-repeat protein At3g58930-like [Brassica napus]|uniref:F-box/LRR-repeat protein At3g58930-like n=1 Tax=Brassica napus TaxID=3708 RepID=UPI002078F2BD|nr:F-box/LRR-repeat protein At3g58930-like [Brassica napus]